MDLPPLLQRSLRERFTESLRRGMGDARWLHTRDHEPLPLASEGAVEVNAGRSGSSSKSRSKQRLNGYITGLALIALLLLAAAVVSDGLSARDWELVAVFAALQALAVVFPLRVAPRQYLSLDTSVLFAAVLLLDPTVAMLLAGIGTLLAEVIRRQPLDQAVFNSAQGVLQTGLAGGLLMLAGWDSGTMSTDRPLAWVIVPLAALVMFLVNELAIAGVVALQTAQSTRALVWRNLRADASTYLPQFALGLLAATLVRNAIWALPLVLVLAVSVYRAAERHVRLEEQAAVNARLYREAEEARGVAEAAVRQREQFMAIASHELRTPITALKASVQFMALLLAQPRSDSGDVRRYVDIMNGEVGRLDELVRDLLDMSRIQQGRLRMRRKPIDLASLGQRVMERVEQTLPRRNQHRFVFDAPQPVEGSWDPTRLDQVLTNLLTNAVKYSPEGGMVALGIYQRGEDAELIVRDEGIGIGPEELAQLFEPFSRGVTAMRTATGSGLGLYIAAQIVEQHGGEITVNSRPGSGTTFIVRLPLAPSIVGDPAAAEAAPSNAHRPMH